MGVLVAQGQGLAQRIVDTANPVVIPLHRTGKAPVLVVESDLLRIGGTAVGHAFAACAGQGQAVDFATGQQTALEGLRQDVPGVGLQVGSLEIKVPYLSSLWATLTLVVIPSR